MPAVGVKLPNGSVLKGGTLSTTIAIVGSAKDNVISGPFEINDTQMVGFNLGSKISGIAAMGGVKTGDTTAVKKMSADIKLSKTGLDANNIYSLLPALGESSGSGTVSPSGIMYFRMTAKVTTSQGLGKAGVDLLTKLNGFAGSAANTAATTGIPVIITGTADNPVITADTSGLMKADAAALKSHSGDLLNKAKGLFVKK
jgi:AsmA protein